MYLFPYGWKVHGPASEETGYHVIKLVAALFVLTIIFDIIMAYYINYLDWSNHFIVLMFMGLFVAIVGCILAISRQPQIRWHLILCGFSEILITNFDFDFRCDLKFKAPGVPFVPAIAIIINIYLILRLSILTLVRFTIWMIAGQTPPTLYICTKKNLLFSGLAMYFCYGIKNSALECPLETRDTKNSQPIELSVPQNRNKPLRPTSDAINKPNGFTGFTSTSTDVSQSWNTFD